MWHLYKKLKVDGLDVVVECSSEPRKAGKRDWYQVTISNFIPKKHTETFSWGSWFSGNDGESCIESAVQRAKEKGVLS